MTCFAIVFGNNCTFGEKCQAQCSPLLSQRSSRHHALVPPDLVAWLVLRFSGLGTGGSQLGSSAAFNTTFMRFTSSPTSACHLPCMATMQESS